MDSKIDQRLADLRREFETGTARLRQLEEEQARLRDTLLRISGAIQVLEELRTPPSTATLETGAASPTADSTATEIPS